MFRSSTYLLRRTPFASSRRFMATEKELKQRLTSVKSIQKITKASKMVAAAKLRGVQNALNIARPFAQPVGKIWQMNAKEETNEEESAGTDDSVIEEETPMIIPLTADRGLCGGVNSAVVKKFRLHVNSLSTTYQVITLGERGRAALQRAYGKNFITALTDATKALVPTFDTALGIASIVLKHQTGNCLILSNLFQSAIAYDTVETSFPSVSNRIKTANFEKYELECLDETEMMKNLAEFTTATQLYWLLLESNTTEQAQRMTAMENSTKNAGELIQSLNLAYNRSRQARITTELTEIISGAAALE